MNFFYIIFFGNANPPNNLFHYLKIMIIVNVIIEIVLLIIEKFNMRFSSSIS